MQRADLGKYIIIIPNAIVPYGYELVQIMAYPTGFVYRFRFDEEWVQENVKNNLSVLVGMKGYIVLRDKDVSKFFPIRYFTIKEAQKIGKIYYFSYELNEIIDFDSKQHLRNNQLEEFNKNFIEFHKTEFINNEPGKHMKPLVLLSNFGPEIKNQNHPSLDALHQENERWINVISTVKNIKLYEDVEFIKIVDISLMKRPAKKADFISNAIEVKEYEDYKLRLLQHIPKETETKKSEPRNIELRGDDKYLRIIRGKQRAVGKYDILTFIFRTSPESGGNNSFLDIELTLKPEAKPYMESKLYLPVVIKRKFGKMIIKLLLAVLFISIFLIIHFHPSSSLQFLRDIALIGITIIIMELLSTLKGFLRRK